MSCECITYPCNCSEFNPLASITPLVLGSDTKPVENSVLKEGIIVLLLLVFLPYFFNKK